VNIAARPILLKNLFQTMVYILNQMLSSLRHDLAIVTGGQKELSFRLADQAFQYAVIHLLRLKERLKSISWSDQATTLYFFKKIQPAYFTEILFYYKVLQTEEQKPSGSANHIRLYYSSLIPPTKEYIQRQHFLHSYQSLGLTYLDETLFGLPPSDISVYPTGSSFHYTEYFNFFSYSLSKINAMERLVQYLDLRYHAAEVTSHTVDGQSELPANTGFSKYAIQMEAREIREKISWLESVEMFHEHSLKPALNTMIKRRRFYTDLLSSLIGNIYPQ
jgi:hypothetical protein